MNGRYEGQVEVLPRSARWRTAAVSEGSSAISIRCSGGSRRASSILFRANMSPSLLAHIFHDGSSRNRALSTRDRRAFDVRSYIIRPSRSRTNRCHLFRLIDFFGKIRSAVGVSRTIWTWALNLSAHSCGRTLETPPKFPIEATCASIADQSRYLFDTH